MFSKPGLRYDVTQGIAPKQRKEIQEKYPNQKVSPILTGVLFSLLRPWYTRLENSPSFHPIYERK